MKYFLTILLVSCFQILEAQNLIFSDSNLKYYLISENTNDLDGDEIPDTNIDLNSDGEIQQSEAYNVQNLVISPGSSWSITSIQDISQFINIKRLTIRGDFSLTEVASLGLDSINHIRVTDFSSITTIDLSDLPGLTSIFLEGLTGVQNLNLQNGSYASNAFSMFYTYVQFACVDSISQEYNTVSQHLVSGGTISTNCSLGIDENHTGIFEVYPNPSQDLLYLNSFFERAELYEATGKLLYIWNQSDNKIDISPFKSGIYILKLQLESDSNIQFNIIKN